jgi:hypothetical protein
MPRIGPCVFCESPTPTVCDECGRFCCGPHYSLSQEPATVWETGYRGQGEQNFRLGMKDGAKKVTCDDCGGRREQAPSDPVGASEGSVELEGGMPASDWIGGLVPNVDDDRAFDQWVASARDAAASGEAARRAANAVTLEAGRVRIVEAVTRCRAALAIVHDRGATDSGVRRRLLRRPVRGWQFSAEHSTYWLLVDLRIATTSTPPRCLTPRAFAETETRTYVEEQLRVTLMAHDDLPGLHVARFPDRIRGEAIQPVSLVAVVDRVRVPVQDARDRQLVLDLAETRRQRPDIGVGVC